LSCVIDEEAAEDDLQVWGIYQPVFFTMDGTHVAARHQDGTLVGAVGMIPGVVSRPASPGEYLQLYGTGFGYVASSGSVMGGSNYDQILPSPLICSTDGFASQGYRLPEFGCLSIGIGASIPEASFEPAVFANPITPSWAGLVEAGLFQVNVQIPEGLGTGDYPIMATLSEYDSVDGGPVLLSLCTLGGLQWIPLCQTQAGVLISVE
jgi:hypothetical protein